MSNTNTTTSRPVARKALAAAVSVILVCIVLAGGFIWWYVKHVAQPAHVTFTTEEITNLQDAGKQLTVRDNGGAQLRLNGPGNVRVALRVAAPPDPDGVFTIGSFQVIRVGNSMARVQPAAAAGQAATLVFRQRTWGMIMDAPTFTIARRIVHEAALAKQLAVSQTQLDALNKIVAEPALKGVYLSALPIPDSDMATATKAWTDYEAAQTGTDAAAKAGAEQVLIKTVGTVGSVAIAKAKQEYADADNSIKQILTAQQIDAYHQGRAVNP